MGTNPLRILLVSLSPTYEQKMSSIGDSHLEMFPRKKIEAAFLKVEPVFYVFHKKYEEMNKIYKILCFGYHLSKF